MAKNTMHRFIVTVYKGDDEITGEYTQLGDTNLAAYVELYVTLLKIIKYPFIIDEVK